MFKTILLTALALAAGVSTCLADPPTRHKKLIEYGWDEPTAAFLREHVAEMEKTPFDGCVLYLTYPKPEGKPGRLSWDGWGRHAITDDEIKASLDDLRATKFTHFTDNFLRFNTTPGDVDWFDDDGYRTVLSNCRLVSRAARQGGCRGIAFDIEHYVTRMFDYHKQKDAKSKTWEQYAAQARVRGREVMTAFQQEYPRVTLLMMFGHELAWEGANRNAEKLSEAQYGLLAPFLDGMYDVAAEGVTIVDGNEGAYNYNRDVARFAAGRKEIRQEVLPIVRTDHAKYERHVSVSFGLWLDFKWRTEGWDSKDASKNYHTPKTFERLVREALAQSDEYVWVYTEKAQWWTRHGGKPSELPPEYDAAIRRAKMAGQ
jgi:hypothetical protein